jgi:hypothetical protein
MSTSGRRTDIVGYGRRQSAPRRGEPSMQQTAGWPNTLDLGRCCRVTGDELTSLARHQPPRRKLRCEYGCILEAQV